MKKLGIIILLALAIGLAGCGNQAAKKEKTETNTRRIETKLGPVDVPENPQRVIATYGMGDVIALGVTPVATYDATGKAYEKAVADLPVWEEFEEETIMAYEPDLILVIDDSQVEGMSKIAPTIFIPFTELSMAERLTFLGEILNKEEEATKQLTEFAEQVADAKSRLAEKGMLDQTFSIFEGNGKEGVWAFGDKWGRGGDLIYSQLALKAPDLIAKEIVGKDQYRELSMEVIPEYSGDVIIFSGELGELSNNVVWQAVPAVKAGKIVPIDHELFFDIDIYSSRVQLEYLVEKLLEVAN